MGKSKQTNGSALVITAGGKMPPLRGDLRPGALPLEHEFWPKFDTRRLRDLSGDHYDISREEIRDAAGRKPWVWPDQVIHFFCDLHADAGAFLRSLDATGQLVRSGPGRRGLGLLPGGEHARFVIGGDCLDKGPSNLGLLRAIRRLIDTGAVVDLLAGNHDLRVLIGLTFAERQEPRLAHLFARMGTKCINLIRELCGELGGTGAIRPSVTDREAERILFPDKAWYDQYPASVAGLIPGEKIELELVLMRAKTEQLKQGLEEAGIRPAAALEAVRMGNRLFTDPGGEFAWFFGRMQLALRSGSFLFIHAGVDDIISTSIRRAGVERLNRQFRTLARQDLFGLYHGPLGNCVRTKYRETDFPFTEFGARDLSRAGIYALVHGHRNVTRGQQLYLRRGVLNFACDASVDINTRHSEGLEGPGAAVLTFDPRGRIFGRSADYPYVKVFDDTAVFEMTTFIENRPAVA
jgi:hypothetical protein